MNNMNRRSFLKVLLSSVLWLTSHKSAALGSDALDPAIPILMFHKVADSPLYPEDITSKQRAELFAYTWAQGFYSVNISDILEGRVDAVCPAGKMPLGISADDAHVSIFFSRENSLHDSLGNEKSFMDIFSQSTRKAGFEPRASFFLGAVNDDRVSTKPEGYFGNILPLADIVEMWQGTAGLEFGYHTRLHLPMKGMGARQSRELIEDQMEDFEKKCVFSSVKRILAYPFGLMPTQEGVDELKNLGFLGAVKAFPGLFEAKYTKIPRCEYNGKLIGNSFEIPRFCVGAMTYSPSNANPKIDYCPINPIEDFQKDFQPPCYKIG